MSVSRVKPAFTFTVVFVMWGLGSVTFHLKFIYLFHYANYTVG